MPRRFAKRRSTIHGWGVFALVDLAADTRLMEYRGRRVPTEQVAQRFGDSAASGHTYLFSLNAHYYIDGNDRGGLARYINHSCDPNCEAKIYVDINGNEERDRVFIQSLRPIRAGEELSFDYAIEITGDRSEDTLRRWTCRCGAAGCRGTMLS